MFDIRKREGKVEKQRLDELLVSVQHGDKQAFEEVYLGTRKGIYAYLYSFTGNHEQTLDLLQDVYWKMGRNIAQYRPGSNPTAWLFSIARSLALNEIKKRSREVLVDFGTYEPLGCAYETDVGSGELIDLIKNTLSQEDCAIVLLHVLGGYKHKEIALLMSMPLGTVLWRYNRSVKRLQTIIKEETP